MSTSRLSPIWGTGSLQLYLFADVGVRPCRRSSGGERDGLFRDGADLRVQSRSRSTTHVHGQDARTTDHLVRSGQPVFSASSRLL